MRWPIRARAKCGDLSEKCPPYAHVFEHLAPGWWGYLGKLLRGRYLQKDIHCWEWTLCFYNLAPVLILPLLFESLIKKKNPGTEYWGES